MGSFRKIILNVHYGHCSFYSTFGAHQIRPVLVKSINGIYVFKVATSGGEKAWTVDLKNGDGSVKEGAADKTDCTINMKEDDFVKLMTGKMQGQQAFMQGKLKIKGYMAMAMKLGKLATTKASL